MNKSTESGKEKASQIPSVRLISVQILQQISNQRGFSNRILDQQLHRYPHLTKSDRGLITHLVYGVLRHRSRLDHLIHSFSKKPNRLSAKVRELLRVAIFELLELRHPPNVVISQAISLTQNIDPSGTVKGFVHAILTKIHNEGERVEAAPKASPIAELEQRWSIPGWLAQRWISQLGEENALLRAKALASPPPIDIRIDLSRISQREVQERLCHDIPGIVVTMAPHNPQALRVEHAGPLPQHPLHKVGLISIQGLAAQQAAIALNVKPGQKVLDACAGMGVKTLQIAEIMQRNGTIVAVEKNLGRVRQHQELLHRGQLIRSQLHLSSIHGDITQSELEEVDQHGKFDGILLDAPCTGLGNLARHPELRWFSTPEDIISCVQLQQQLLASCLPRLSPHGRMVYSVCSLEPEEGPHLCRTFAQEHLLNLVQEQKMTPEEHHCDGFYLAVFEYPKAIDHVKPKNDVLGLKSSSKQ